MVFLCFDLTLSGNKSNTDNIIDKPSFFDPVIIGYDLTPLY